MQEFLIKGIGRICQGCVKKSLYSFLVLAVGLFIIPSISGFSTMKPIKAMAASKSNKIVLEWVTSSYHKEEWWKHVKKLFEKEHPNVEIKMWWGGDPDNYQTIRIAAGNCPDILWLRGRRDWVDAGVIMCLDDVLESSAWESKKKFKDTFLPAFLKKYKGHYWCVPWDLYTDGFFWYNVDIFKKYGYVVPTTWKEFLSLCEALKKAGITPLAMAGNYGAYASYYWRLLTQRMVGLDKIRATASPFCKPGNHWTDPVFLKPAQMAAGLADKGYFSQGYQGMDALAHQMEFVQGKTAMILIGNWFPGEMKGIIPKDFHMDFFIFPKVEGGKGDPTVVMAGNNEIAISATTKHPEMAVEFLKFLTSRKIVHYFAVEAGWLYATIGANSPDITTEFDRRFLDYLSKAHDTFSWRADPDFAPNRAIGDKVLDLSVSLMNKQISPEEFLRKLEDLMASWRKAK